MVYSECCREKLSQYKIEGQSKPFVDRDLQLQLPGANADDQTQYPFSSIYSHYMGSNPSIPYLSAEINEKEFYRAMQEAEFSYQNWKHMQQQLQRFLS